MTVETATMPRARTNSLNDVRAIIPETCYQPSRSRATITMIQASILYLLPVVALGFTNQWWALLLLWTLAGLGVSGLFVLGHDASHGALLNSRTANRVLAQVCMGPSVHAEAAWDLGHNRIHHGYTTRQGFDFVWHPLTVEDYRELSAFGRVLHKIEWSALGSGLYFLRSVWWDKMWRMTPAGKHAAKINRDKLILGGTLAAIAVSLMVIGALTGGVAAAIWMPIKLLVIPFLIFTQIIGWTVYVHHVDPDIKWWTKKEWTQFNGQMESTTILKIPKIVNTLWFHNIFVHVPHHVDARIPFHQLPAAAAAIAANYPETVRSLTFSPRNYLRAARQCKLYDFEASTWLPYSAARS